MKKSTLRQIIREENQKINESKLKRINNTIDLLKSGNTERAIEELWKNKDKM